MTKEALWGEFQQWITWCAEMGDGETPSLSFAEWKREMEKPHPEACVEWISTATGARIYSAPLSLKEAHESVRCSNNPILTKGVVFLKGTPEFAEAEKRWQEHLESKKT